MFFLPRWAHECTGDLYFPCIIGLVASRNDLATCIWEIPGKPDLIFADIQSARKHFGGWIMLEQWQIVAIPMLAFVCEYMDSTLGMGYGTTLTPAFLLMGFAPMQIVPVILLSELISGISAAFFHNHEGNVNFKLETTGIPDIIERFRSLGCIESFKQVIPLHLKVAILLAACSVVGKAVYAAHSNGVGLIDIDVAVRGIDNVHRCHSGINGTRSAHTGYSAYDQCT